MTYDDDTGELPDLTNRALLRLVMQEIADTNKELSGKINDLGVSLRKEMVDVKNSLSSRIDAVASDLRSLRSQVHQNQIAFMANHDALEKRVKVLEMAA